ncbi:MAG: glycosyltransferase family 2 protein [Lentisphaeria bacterium]|nr:glycosyltransferase family 2 protein [Lentisphaeria bacterium]
MSMQIPKKIAIVSSCYNEESNLKEFYCRCIKVLDSFSDKYCGEIILEDNYSTDNSRQILRELAAEDKRVKVILNANNFGANRSGFNCILSADADAVIPMCSDLQEPPEVIPELIRKWEEGYKVVCAVKEKSKENPVIFALRKLYYWLLKKCSDTELISNFTGFGLYDRCFMDALKRYKDPYPYFRGLVSEIGFKRCEVTFTQEKRKGGRSSYNFFSYYDYAMTGFVNHTKLPLRLAVFSGFFIAFLSLLTALGYFIYKLCNWNSFQVGMAPLVIGLFFFSAIQLIFIGILGEYIGAIYTQVKNKPLVIEEEFINFNEKHQS